MSRGRSRAGCAGRRAALLGAWLLLTVAGPAHAVPAAPVLKSCVPLYAPAATSLVVTWTSGGPGATGYEIQRRNATTGAAFQTIASALAPTAVEYADTPPVATQSYVYRVRATSTSGVSAWSAESTAMCSKQVWPLQDGSREVLHSFGQPISEGLNRYFHAAVDLSAPTGSVVVVTRGGIVEEVQGPGRPDAKGGLTRVAVQYQKALGQVATYQEVYGHVTPDVGLGVGDVVQPGEYLGYVAPASAYSTYGAPQANHLHWGATDENRLAACDPADRDPNGVPPQVCDVHGDGTDFVVVDAAANNPLVHDNRRAPAWGDVDFLVDACDDMTPTGTLLQAPAKIGYWIARDDGVPTPVVKSPSDPYVLQSFATAALSGPDAATAEVSATVYWDLPAVPGVSTWDTVLTWIVTNASEGAAVPLDSNCWRTDARAPLGPTDAANGSSLARARDPQEALFPDGRYLAMIHLADLDPGHDQNVARSVLVDNFRPYVRAVTVRSGEAIVSSSSWTWDGTSGVRRCVPATFEAAAPGVAARTQDVLLEVTFSEPMSHAQIVAVRPLGGVPPTLTSGQPEGWKTVWTGVLSHADLSDDGADDGAQMLEIEGADLAGHRLRRSVDRSDRGAGHDARNPMGAFQGPDGPDTVHGFRVGGPRGAQSIRTLFVRAAGSDPVGESVSERAFGLTRWLSAYYGEVSYDAIHFAASGHGWYALDHPLDWYYAPPRTPLVDLVGEAISKASAAGVDFSGATTVLVVTDETAARDEWSTTGPWSYAVGPATYQLAAGVVNLASPAARVTNATGRMLGLRDLFAYPHVTAARAFVGPWSHMSERDRQVHLLGWEKSRLGWVDGDGAATGKRAERVEKPQGDPILDRRFDLGAIDSVEDDLKVLTVEIAQGVAYTIEYRRAGGQDVLLPGGGVLVTKVNEQVAEGEGPALVQESEATPYDLDDAPHVLTAPRNVFQDLGTGVRIEVLATSAARARISLDYVVPSTKHDLWVERQDERWETGDIWVDAPDLLGNFEADPRAVRTAGEQPVVGVPNRLVGRVRNAGPAAATNFEVELRIREPWGAGSPWESLHLETVALLPGQLSDPGADHLIVAEWTPMASVHTCVLLEVRGDVPNDENPANNRTQENIRAFVSSPGSPYAPIVSDFEVGNPYPDKRTILFHVAGLPPGWTYAIHPERLVLAARQTAPARIEIQPAPSSPLCARDLVTVTACTPETDTLVPIDGFTLDIALKSRQAIDQASWTDGGCTFADGRKTEAVPGQSRCHLYTQGLTEPPLAGAQVVVVHESPTGERVAHTVPTDAQGRYVDIRDTDQPGDWRVRVVLEATACRDRAETDWQVVSVPGPSAAPTDPCEDLRRELLALTNRMRVALEGRDPSTVADLVSQAHARIKKESQRCPQYATDLPGLYGRLRQAVQAGDRATATAVLKQILAILDRP